MNKRIFFIIFGVEFRKITLLQYCILLCVVFFIKQENKNTWGDANFMLPVYKVVFFISFIIVVYIQICEQYLAKKTSSRKWNYQVFNDNKRWSVT